MFIDSFDTGGRAERKKLIITWIGIAIVFATYIAKENRRDRLKDQFNAIDNQHNIFFIEEEITAAPAVILRNERNIVFSNQTPISKRKGETETQAERDQGQLDLMQFGLSALANQEANIVGLVNRLHNWEQFMPTLNGLDKKLLDFKHSLAELSALSGDGAFASRVKQVNELMDNIGADEQSLAREVEDEANKQSEALHNSYDFWEIISNILYVTGWIIGLVGQFGFGGLSMRAQD